MEVSAATDPADVVMLHDALEQLLTASGQHRRRPISSKTNIIEDQHRPTALNLGLNGTAMRFLTAFCAMRPGLDVVLDGAERMHHRPIGQLVDALRSLGADIEYLGEQGFPPLRIRGRCLLNKKPHMGSDRLDPVCSFGEGKVVMRAPQSTQFVSALLLCGIEVETDMDSPYIDMTRAMIAHYKQSQRLTNQNLPSPQLGRGAITGGGVGLERCWSSAAFWYEYVALHGGTLLLEGLREDSLQGDRIVAELFRPLGVETHFTPEGAMIANGQHRQRPTSPTANIVEDQHRRRPISSKTNIGSAQYRQSPTSAPPNIAPLGVDFSACPDLYPAVALTCERMGIRLEATGTESLRIKESDRLEAVARHEVRGDHRMAMALLCADYPVADTDLACICKSYPTFYEQFKGINSQIVNIVPRRGINDDGLGKKHALRKLISQADSEFVWLHDDDITLPEATDEEALAAIGDADLLILPLEMTHLSPGSDRTSPCLGRGETWQIWEYAALQELTLWSCEIGHPVMCSGANMVVRRSAWLESADDLHPEIPSGDDMFLLESFKRKGRKIICSRDPRLTAIVYPVQGWRAFLRQRMRWAGKAPAYRDRDILLCGAVVSTALFLQFLFPPLVLIHFPLEYALLRRHEKAGGDMGRRQYGGLFLLSLLYPYYALLSLVGGLFRRKKW